MDIATIERRLSSYLEKAWTLRDVKPFLLVYVELLLLFKNEIAPVSVSTILERQKQLLGEEFQGGDFDKLRVSSRKRMDEDLRTNSQATREAMLNRMLFCAFLDTEETDFFYLTEPIFEFVRTMEVSSDDLTRILASKFGDLEMQG